MSFKDDTKAICWRPKQALIECVTTTKCFEEMGVHLGVAVPPRAQELGPLQDERDEPALPPPRQPVRRDVGGPEEDRGEGRAHRRAAAAGGRRVSASAA